MTDLTCSAEGCAHNQDRYCCKGEIRVEGADAACCQDTCCASFDRMNQGKAVNNFETPKRSLNVACEAVSCVYNDSRRCTAEEISIAGHGAEEAGHTQCASYRSR